MDGKCCGNCKHWTRDEDPPCIGVCDEHPDLPSWMVLDELASCSRTVETDGRDCPCHQPKEATDVKKE